MKSQRQAKILSLIQEYEIETQMELTDKLNEFGFAATQATVSRDIKELHLVKSISKSGLSCRTMRPVRRQMANGWVKYTIYRYSSSISR